MQNFPETPEALTFAVWDRLLEHEQVKPGDNTPFEDRALLLLTKVAAAVQAISSVLGAVATMH